MTISLSARTAGCALALGLFGCGSSDDESPGTTRAAACDTLPARAAGRGFTLDEGTLELKPGQDGIFCRQMPVPAEYAGGDYFMTGLDAAVSLGTHHFVMTFSDEPMSAVAPLCEDTGSGQVRSGNASFQDFDVNPDASPIVETIRRIAFGGGGGESKVRFPPGYGKPMPTGFFESSHHLLNLRQDPMDICGRFNVYAAPAEEIEHPMGVLFANALHVDVAPNSAGKLEATMIAPEPIDLVVFMSHSHNFLTRFEMFVHRDGKTEAEPVYVNTDWENPLALVQDPPISLKAGDGIMFRCSYQNSTPQKLGWGVIGGEMCMPFALYSHPKGTARRVPPNLSVLMTDATPKVLEVGTGAFGG
ncbi:MAG TPA: hypothetical protein VI072_35385 [Polyangiaceae bacterium]